MPRNLTEIETWLDRKKGEAGVHIEEFKTRLSRHPNSALAHSLSTIRSASMLALTSFYQTKIVHDLGEGMTREDVVREVRALAQKELLEIALNVASSPFTGTAELSRRCYLECLAQFRIFLGEPQ